MTAPLTESDVRAALDRVFPSVLEDLRRLVAVPSVSFPEFDRRHVRESAELTAQLLQQCGLTSRIVSSGDGQPAVITRRPAPPGAPTVLLYAHHDVQPIGDREVWRSEPFTVTERDGRLYGRGVADDKAGVLAHVAALRALGDALGVGVVAFVEGEEEYGSPTLEDLLRIHREELTADVIVIADSANWDVGVPALTTSLRGIVNLFVKVSTLHSAVHSGMYGGAVPDALTVLSRLLASLHDDAGDVAVPGLVQGSASALEYPVDRLRAEAGLLDGVQLTGTGPLVDRLWTRPSVSVLGIDAPTASEAPNALVPTATAKVSVRIPPGEDPKSAYDAILAHLRAHIPWGATLEVTREADGAPCVIDTSGPVYEVARASLRDAWDGTEPVEIGLGGSIPFIATFQQMYPEAAILVTGMGDPTSNLHGPNESID